MTSVIETPLSDMAIKDGMKATERSLGVLSVSNRQATGVRKRVRAEADTAPYENSRNEILEVALKLFADQGFDAVTVRRLAQAAKVTSPTIYHFFGDKRGLYRAALLEAYDRMSFIAETELDPGLPPKERLFEMIMGQMARHDANGVAYQLFLRDMLDTDASIRREAVADTFATVYASLCELIAQLNPALDAHGITKLILSLYAGNRQTEGFAALLPERLRPMPDKGARGTMVRNLVDMIVATAPKAP